MAQDSNESTKRDVCFTDGILTVNGVKISMPPRPVNEKAAIAYEILSLIGVFASVALVVSQLISFHRDKSAK